MALAQPRVVINEFAYDDTSTDNLEFIELYNADTVPVDISGWIVTAATSSQATTTLTS